MTLYYSDHYPIPLPPGHKFPAGKYALLRQKLEADGFYRFEAAPLAERAAIERAHDPAYVASILEGTVDARVMRRIGFPWSEALVRRSLASVGGTLAATADALAGGFGGNLAGGTHHAFYGEGSGFCVFNDLAVAIRQCGRPAAVIDLDVHQGDGTASIFENNDNVLTVSLHGEHNFPFRKQRSRIDVALPDGTGDDEYLERLGGVLLRVAEFRPEIVYYQSGVDALAGDRLGRLRLSAEGLAARDRAVFEWVRREGVPVVVTLGGGYAEPIDRTVEAHANTFRTAAAVLQPFPQNARL
jgi:acetoin utilization deacetylase AcuC-like enzyme